MEVARSHCGAAAWEGRIYVFGGGGAQFQPLNSVAIYDPGTRTWSAGREMPTARSGLAATTLKDRIFVMAGGFKKPDGTFQYLRIVEIYDPARDTWEKGPDLLMPHDAPAAAVLEECIYVFGGHHPEATAGGPLVDPGFSFCEVLAPSGQWREISPLPTPHFSLAAVAFQGRVLALGGGAFREGAFRNDDLVEAFDPRRQSTSGGWEAAGELTLPWPAAGVGACCLDGRLAVFGGNSGKRIESRAAVFDPDKRVWRDLPPMPEPRAAMAVVTVGETVYLVGGRGADGKTPLNTVVSYRLHERR